jgi:hypothetical protein
MEKDVEEEAAAARQPPSAPAIPTSARPDPVRESGPPQRKPRASKPRSRPQAHGRNAIVELSLATLLVLVGS